MRIGFSYICISRIPKDRKTEKQQRWITIVHMTLLDKDIREPLFDWLEQRYGRIRILEEKQTGRARADVVMVTERYLCGIEIKSDADTYARLKKQVRNYYLYYDRNIVVVGSSHGLHIYQG